MCLDYLFDKPRFVSCVKVCTQRWRWTIYYYDYVRETITNPNQADAHCAPLLCNYQTQQKTKKKRDDDDGEQEQEKVPTNDQKWECQINAMHSERREQQREMRAELSLKWFTSSLPRNNLSHSENIHGFTSTNHITSIFNIQLDLFQRERRFRRRQETLWCSKFNVGESVYASRFVYYSPKASLLTCSEFSNTQWRWESKTLWC